ncbi:MAG TPA: EscI/YscI/HrpB family type III secretion system inner rod protein, partial [Opitutales bacterium]|nr:EscI/YscI/HrpB family type III secretion system inner rod protein [Opitutales bacterium]
ADQNKALQPPTPPVPPDPAQVEAFEQNMMAAAADGSSYQYSNTMLSNRGAMRDPTLQGLQGVTFQSSDSLGDAILNGISQESLRYRGQVQNIQSDLAHMALEPEKVDAASLYKMQFDLMQFGLHQNLASKIANKISQGIQTLFKNQ